MGASREYRFDGWTLSVATGELSRHGRRVRLQRHPADVLEALLACPGELVTREALIGRLWPRGVVEFDTALNTAVHRLRTALHDSAESPRYIETIPRRGYRFIGTVDPSDTWPATPPAPSAMPGSDARTVAGGPGTGRTPVAADAWHRRPWVAWSLGLVSILALAGWLVPDGDVRPLAAADGPPRAHAPAPVPDLLARADFLFQRRMPGDLELAQREYEAALAADPGLARAWAGLAGLHWIRTVLGMEPPDKGLPLVRDAAERALAIDPGLAEAHLRLHNYLQAEGRTAQADAHLQRAMALEPDDPLVLAVAASMAAHDGRWDEAVELQRRAVRAAPLSGVTRYNLASLLYLSGRVGEAGQEIQRLHDTQAPNDASRELGALVAVLEHRCDAALTAAGRLAGADANAQIRALALHCLGHGAEAEEATQALIRASGQRDPFRIAETLAFRGEADRAFDWLARGLTTIAPGTAPWVAPVGRRTWMLRQSPLLASLRADPRWAAWLGSAGLVSRSGPPPAHGG